MSVYKTIGPLVQVWDVRDPVKIITYLNISRISETELVLSVSF